MNHLNNFADEMKKEKEVSKQLGTFATELKGRIDEKAKELSGFKNFLADCDRELQAQAQR